MYSRRKFIQNTALASAGLVITNPMRILATQDDRPLNIGVIGTGDRGTGIIHILKDNSKVKVVACCDVIPFRLKAAAKASGGKPYKDYRKLLENKNVEAVVIATPFGLHGTMALDALQAGKHVYCEKTMVRGVEEIQTVIDAHRETTQIFQVGHQYNSAELYQKVSQIVQSGYLGEITAFECQWNRNGDWRRPVPHPKWERAINWRMYKENSGGLVAELCSHQIDFICRTLGEAPEVITGFGGIDYWKDGRETFDNVHLLFKYPSGIDASFTCTTTNAFEGYQIKILGKKGTIIMNTEDATIYLENAQLKEHGIVDGVSGATKMAWQKGKGVPIEASKEDITKQAIMQFYHSVRSNTPILADIKSGAITSKCVQMCLDVLHQEKVAYWKDYPELRF